MTLNLWHFSCFGLIKASIISVHYHVDFSNMLAVKHEDLNLYSQLPYKEPGKAASAYNPHAMEAETDDSQSSLARHYFENVPLVNLHLTDSARLFSASPRDSPVCFPCTNITGMHFSHLNAGITLLNAVHSVKSLRQNLRCFDSRRMSLWDTFQDLIEMQ